jgi:hypothetical protein
VFHVVDVETLKVPTTTPVPVGIIGAVSLVKIFVAEEKFNFLCPEI